MNEWNPDSWRDRVLGHGVVYADPAAVTTATDRLSRLPPLVTSWEIERLRAQLGEAERGERFLLQGGDCAETLVDCRPDAITATVKVLMQMSLVIAHGIQRPVIRVGRLAGQYAKPRSSPIEVRAVDGGGELELPSYMGDLVNGASFDAAAREPDPERLLAAYSHSAMTLNFVRSLAAGGFADLHHPENWDLDFIENDDLSESLRNEYERLRLEISGALRFAEALSERRIEEVSRAEFFTSHEGLSLPYESSQTREVPRRDGFYDLSTHMPWIGERTRDAGGAHVEFFRGIRNPIGVKLGPTASPDDVIELARILDPHDEPGRLCFITRFGADRVRSRLPHLVEAMKAEGRSVVWVSDPMHGNTETVPSGRKTRSFANVVAEIDETLAVHRELGSILGGVHLELTGEAVTECVGGAAGVSVACLDRDYRSQCDPRLNYAQSLELAFRLARRLRPEEDAPYRS